MKKALLICLGGLVLAVFTGAAAAQQGKSEDKIMPEKNTGTVMHSKTWAGYPALH